MIDLKGLDKAEVLAALYNNSKVQGLGVLQARPGNMTTEQARHLLSDDRPRKYFDYLYGSVMKIDLTGDELNPSGYDRDLGEGAAARAIAGLGIKEGAMTPKQRGGSRC